MSPLRCTVLAANPTAGIAPAVISTLHQLQDIVVEPAAAFGSEPSHWTGADGVIVISDALNLTPGLNQIASVLNADPCCSVVAVGDALNESEMLSLLAAGACDFVAAPFAAGELQARVRHALGLAPAIRSGTPGPVTDLRLRELIGASSAFVMQTAKLPMIARHDVSVLLLGETGTGKEVRAGDPLSVRPRQARVTVNSAATTDLIEKASCSVMCERVRRSTARKGLVSEAQGGTLLLDEIDCLSYGAQAKLLGSCRTRSFGPSVPTPSAAPTCASLRRATASLANWQPRGTFRRDCTSPPRAHGDVAALARAAGGCAALALYFIQRFGREFSRRVTGLAPHALRRLSGHSWPGNVRELKHVIERAVLLSNGPVLGADDLDLAGEGAEPAPDESFRAAKARIVANFERAYIEQLLSTCGGNVTHAARLAKKNRRAFWELLRKHRIDPQSFR